MELIGKTVLITGASMGLGRELALKFAGEGCNLILNARGKEELLGVESKCKDLGAECRAVIGDMTTKETITNLEKSSKEAGLDILVNNAGIIILKPFEENTDEELDRIFEINVKAHMRLTHKLLPIMKAKKEGQIINIVSNAGLGGRVNHSLYCATKFAMKGFTDSIRQETNRYGIKVMGVYPGGIRTNLFDEIKGHDTSGFMDPKEVAGIIVESCKLSKTASVDDLIINRTNK
jgi:short-subunit dehydrogenase